MDSPIFALVEASLSNTYSVDICRADLCALSALSCMPVQVYKKRLSRLRQSCQANAQRLSLRNLGHSGGSCCLALAMNRPVVCISSMQVTDYVCCSYILFFSGGLWSWWLYFGLLYFCGWFVRALLILYAWAAVWLMLVGCVMQGAKQASPGTQVLSLHHRWPGQVWPPSCLRGHFPGAFAGVRSKQSA